MRQIDFQKYVLRIFDLGCWLSLTLYVLGFYFNTALVVTSALGFILLLLRADLTDTTFAQGLIEIEGCFKNREGPKTSKGWLLATALSLSLIFFLTAPLFRHAAFGTGRWDLGALENIIWRHAHGYALSTYAIYNDPSTPLYFIHQHMSLWLFPMALVYKIFPYTATLLLTQSVALAAVSIPLWKIGRKILPPQISPLLLPTLFFVSDTVHRVNLWDVHENAFIPLMQAWAFFFFLSRRFRLCFIFTLAVALFKEDAFVIAGAMGFYFFGSYKNWGRAVLSLIFGFLIFLLYGALVSEGIPLSLRYGYLGSSMAEARSVVLHRPWVFLEQLFSSANKAYYLSILLFCGGIWIFGGLALFTVAPTFFEIALSTYDQMRRIDNHYIIPLLVPLIFCSAQGVCFLAERLEKNRLTQLAAMGLLLTALSFSTTESGKIKDFVGSPEWAMRSCYGELLSKIPDEAPVYTEDLFYSHLNHRPKALAYTEKISQEVRHGYFLISSLRRKPDSAEKIADQCGYQLFKR